MSNKDYRELQVSSSHLVVIFIGILIICGISFLLGVNVGKKKTQLQGQTSLPSPQVLSKVQDQKPEPKQAGPSLKPEAAPGRTSKPASEQAGESGGAKTPSQAKEPAPGPASKTIESAKPKPAPAKPATASPTTSSKKTPPPLTAAKGTFSIQVAAFEKREDALQAAKKFDGQGYICRVLDPFPGDRIKYYRVRIGAFKTRDEALAARNKFLTTGHKSDYFVVQN
jgi:cell division protein FtsN